MDDYSAIEELLQEIKKQSEDELDKIQKLQYQWFIENLTDILQRLEYKSNIDIEVRRCL